MTKTYRKRNESSRDYFQRSTEINQTQLFQILKHGKTALDNIKEELGRCLVESLLLMNREQIGGQAYLPNPGYKKWSCQKGSVYVGNGKLSVMVPRLREKQREVVLPLYEKLKSPDAFSHELLNMCMAGLSGRKYEEVLAHTGEKFGISKSAVSQKVVRSTLKQLKELQERSLGHIEPFALFIDGVHKAGTVVVAAIAVDCKGEKYVLGLWEGATENHEVCEALLSDLENRGLSLHPNILFVTDGGKGLHKCLRLRFGKKLLLQRCIIHKKRNILGHLPKRYHSEFKQRYDRTIGMTSYEEARNELKHLLKWLEKINTNAMNSLSESGELLLTVHRIGLPLNLRGGFLTTNVIESPFNSLDYIEKNVKRFRGGVMLKRWMASTLLYREKHFRKVKGYQEIKEFAELLAKKSFSLEQENLVA